MTKTEVIRLRITPDLKARVEEEAKKQNRTVSNYLENLILQEVQKNDR